MAYHHKAVCIHASARISAEIQDMQSGRERVMKKLRNLPTETPISQHIKTFVAKEGIAPQIEVAIKRIVESRIEYFLPTRSAMKPQIRDPMTVPDIATVGSTAPCVLVKPYSASRPGIIKPIVAGFIMSIVIASVSTADSLVCAGVQSALCSSSKYAEERNMKIFRMTVNKSVTSRIQI